jgi:uncharacterized protein YjfI (DUF2170 family)
MCMLYMSLKIVNKSGHGLVRVYNCYHTLKVFVFGESTQIIVIMEIWVMMMDIINLN